MGHLGLTPQSVHVMGGYRVQGKEPDAAEALVGTRRRWPTAGCFAIVLEGVPDVVAAGHRADRRPDHRDRCRAPPATARSSSAHDLLGFGEPPRKFVRRYADLRGAIVDAVQSWASDVRSGAFPSDAETYHPGPRRPRRPADTELPSRRLPARLRTGSGASRVVCRGPTWRRPASALRSAGATGHRHLWRLTEVPCPDRGPGRVPGPEGGEPLVRPYESMIIFDAELEEPAIAAVLDRSTELIRSGGGERGAIDRWGAADRSPTRCGTVARGTTS